MSLRLVLKALAESWYGIGSTQRDNYLTAEDIFRDGQTYPRIASNLVNLLNCLFHFSTLTSNQAGLPAELKHINKRRKRN